MRWPQQRRQTSDADADGEVVWFWRPDAGVKFLGSQCFSGMTGARKPGPREEHEGNRKTIARGMPEMFGLPVVTMLVCFHSSHTRLRVRPAPGIPCALFDLRGWLLNDSGAFVPRDRGGVSWREPNAAIRSQGKPDLIGASVFLANDLLAKKNG